MAKSFTWRAVWRLIALLAWAAIEVAAQDPEAVRAELGEVKQRIQQISDRLAGQRRQKEVEQAVLAKAETELSRLTVALRETRAGLDETERRQHRLGVRADELRASIDRHRHQLSAQLRIAYRIGTRSRLRTLLANRDPRHISRQLAMHGYIARARLETVKTLDRKLVDLEQVLDEQIQLARQLEHLHLRQLAVVAERDQAMQQKQSALNELARQIQTQAAELESLRRSAAELESLLAELADVLSDIPIEIEMISFEQLRGELPMPSKAPVKAAFSDRRNGDIRWQGWLINTAPGDPVEAVAYGRVAYADWLRGYGMMLIIDHGHGFMTLYGRNQSLLAEVGDWVRPGDVIALAGNSGGGDSEPGLYFQLRRDGEPIDPAGWIKR
ncbi:MAG: peptidoglycan DD-metalloendopeptidase family protein [Xanthomonadaceae bacterium]|nr:peptidoglycan DD-metalloendopeptidase family protein [Xanthomonadaceae bacterium]